MNSAETLIIWFLVGTFAFFIVGLSWTAGWFFDIIKNRGANTIGPIERDDIDPERSSRINRSLIARYDVIEDLLSVARKNGEEKMIEQIKIMKKDFLFMMQEFSLHPFKFETGDKIGIDDRKKIVLVDQVNGSNEVSESVAVGFTYQPEGDKEPQLVRKAAVKLGA